MQTDGLESLWFIKESNRVYPHGQLASHILGDVNVDAEGIEGIELLYNERLRGKVASVSAIKDALGRPTFIDEVAGNEAKNGDSLTLTIDSTLQYEVEQILGEAMERTQANSGVVIVMNAENGEILALANEPSFNPNLKSSGPERRRNRAITDGFEPGSTLKAVLLASALSSGWKLSDELWGEQGSFWVQGKKISESEAHERFEWLSLKKMIQVSSNVVAAKLALKLGSDAYQKTLRSLGFGSKTRVGFPGEMGGRLPEKKWSELTLANVGFGQGLLVTPLQMVRAYASFANGGWLVQPSILKAHPEASRLTRTRVFSPRVAREVSSALEGVTGEGGTGRRASVLGYRIAGKTGTAQLIDPQTKRYSKEKYNPSFIGFPLDVGAKIVIFAGLSEPKGSYYAAETAVPLFREVLERTARRCSLPMKMDVPQILKQPLAQKISIDENDLYLVKKLPTLKAGKQAWELPSLRGLTPREALSILKGYPLKLNIQGSGIIVSQVPEPGKRVAEGATLQLHLAGP